MADEPWSLTVPAASFARQSLMDPINDGQKPAEQVLIPRIQTSGVLGGEGWVEYDFQVPETGWYTVGTARNDDVGDHDFFIDKDIHVYGGIIGRITNAYLTAGPHVLRVQRYTFPGLSSVTGFKVEKSAGTVADSTRIEVIGSRMVFRKGESLDINIFTGGRSAAGRLTAWVKTEKSDTTVATFSLPLPASPGEVKKKLSIPCTAEGLFYIAFGDSGKPVESNALRELQFVVIDTHPVKRETAAIASGQIKKTLIKQIDCVRQVPDYLAGETHVVRSPLGDYRESGDRGYLESPKDYDFFTYRIDVPEAQKPYLVQIDYPDDDYRTFCIGLMEENNMDYPPVGGVDSGGLYALSHKMQTQSYLVYPRDRELVLSFVNAQNGRKAAAARVRLYRIDGPLPALNVPETGGRSFGYWLEEGDRWATFNGAPDKSLSGYLISMNRWAEVARYMGVNTLMPTVAIYQSVLYPSSYYDGYFRAAGGPRDPMPLDIVRLLLLVCEKYDLKLLPEFHPTWNGYKRRMVDDEPYQSAPDPKPHLMVSRDGRVGDGPFDPYFNPIYPANEAWYIGMLGEFADRYQDSPALAGVSLRAMGWVWESHNGWPSLIWGYDDYTVHQFEKDCHFRVPGDAADPNRFRKRYDWLMANAKESWIAWRCGRIADLYRRISSRIRRAKPDLLVVTPVHGKLDNAHEYDERFSNDGDYQQIYRESGYDMQKMSAIPGVIFLNAMYYYGRRATDEIEEQRRLDFLLDPRARTAFVGPRGRTGFLFSNSYFEADSTIDPARMGLPKAKPGGWVGAVNPPGRQYLQRYAVDLADSDASLIFDGGEGYLHGQPELRAFLAEYRRLPVQRFTPRADARDPLAVWQFSDGKRFWFYAVNRTGDPVKIAVRLAGQGAVTHVADGKVFPTVGGTLTLVVQPFQLIAFHAPATVSIRSASADVPQAMLAAARAQVGWLTSLSRSAQADPGLNSSQKALLAAYAGQARQSWRSGHVWQATAIVKNHLLLPIYNQLGEMPPDIYAWKAPPMPMDAVTASALAADASAVGDAAPAISLTPSEEIDPQWTGTTLLTTRARVMSLNLGIPVAGKYSVTLGQVSGGEFGPLNASLGGQPVGTLGESAPKALAVITKLPPVALQAGKQELVLSRASGAETAIHWLTVMPNYADISRNFWSTIGPFPSLSDINQPGDGFRIAYGPEKQRDLTVSYTVGTNILHWEAGDSYSAFIDLAEKYHVQGTGIAYGVTYVFAPSSRMARLSYDVDWWMKGWINGQLFKDMTFDRGAKAPNGRFIQDIPLKAGWNELLVKVESGSAGNGYSVAISNPGDLNFSASPPLPQ